MVTYKYVARTAAGEKVKGVIEAFDELEATAHIRNQYQMVVSLKEIRTVPPGVLEFLTMDLGGSKLHAKAFSLMCNQFATILAAGIPIARAVRLIADKTTDKQLHSLLVKVGNDVEAGRTISASFEEHGGSFLPATFVETVRAGEEAGDLSNAFELYVTLQDGSQMIFELADKKAVSKTIIDELRTIFEYAAKNGLVSKKTF